MEEVLLSLKKISPSTKFDSIKEKKMTNKNLALDVLYEAQVAWSSLERFRRERERNKRYNFGYQWDDEITTPEGEKMTESEYIKRQGNVPLKQNIIRRLTRAFIGVYRSQSKEPTCTARDRDEQKLGECMSIILQCNMQINKLKELHARSVEEFLISGLIVHRKWYGWKNDRLDCWTDYVQPNNVFIDPNMRDFRGWDCNLIGEIHDISFNTVCQRFAKKPEDVEYLQTVYKRDNTRNYFSQYFGEFGYSKINSFDFLTPSDLSRCRVIEVWRKESKQRYRCHDLNNGEIFKIEVEDYEDMVEKKNQKRISQGLMAGMREDDIPLIKAEWFMDDYWYYYFLSPYGDVLEEGETPYEHKGSPYVFKAYPFIDGEIHSFVSDIIDQQRYVNRLITLNDWMMRSSAKGVLLVPEDCISDKFPLSEITSEWSKFDGVIVIKKGAVNLPQQIANRTANIGIGDLLNLQLKLIEDISGINGALQGKQGYAGTSASLYAQQTQNGTVSLLDLLEAYSDFVIDGAYKDVNNIQQFYDQKQSFNIAGKPGLEIEYDPGKMRDVQFDLSIVESKSTPAYRQTSNDFLLEIWRANQISLEQLLRYGDFDFADELLQNIQSQREQLEQGNTPEGLSQDLLQQVQNGSNSGNVQRAYEILNS